MVAVASPPFVKDRGAAGRGRPQRRFGWALGAGAVVVLGAGLRLAIGAGSVGDRSAAVMMILLGVAVWSAGVVASSPRTAFFITLGVVALLDFAALPARNAPIYDDREAVFRTDQVLTAIAAGPQGVASARPMLSVLVEPVYGGAQPAFGLAGEIGGEAVTWDCAFRPGMQRLSLPIPGTAINAYGVVDVRLRLTGSPTRETDYLLVYSSSAGGGFLVSIVDAAGLGQDTTICAAR